uniref:Leucine rich repeat containing 29 n=1 Tax=Macrostomum lignano TaxID=282301 RepID=A0A1I8HK89_9PLAT
LFQAKPTILDLVEETVDVALSEYICRCLSGGQIRVLSLRQCRISDDSLAFVLTNLAYSKVATLNLTLGTIDSSRKIKQLTKYLPKSHVTNLSLHGSPLTSRHLQHLLPSLLALPTLASLDLGDCNLTDDCAAALSRHLLSSSTSGMSTSLACLALSGNADISSSGWCRIFLAIGLLPSLRDLRLDFTRLGDEGVRQLAILLAGGTCGLRCLDLDSCGITDDGAA